MKTMRVGRRGGLLLAAMALSAGWVRAESRTWTGAVNNDWSVAGNWDPADSAPQADDTVTITNGTPVVSSSTPALTALTITNATLTATNWTTVIAAATVTVRAGGVITCAGPFGNAPAMTNRVHILCTDLTIDAGGAVNVNGKGYWGSTTARTAAGPGGGTDSVWTPTAGGHGGIGGGATSGQYGNAAEPELAGSGGGRATGTASHGSDGGGIVRIEAAGDVLVNGSILANSTDNSTRGSSGAGGSIYITCQRLLGSGLVRADGGQQTNSDSNPGSGAGGRVAIHNNPAMQGGPGSSGVRFSAMGGYRSHAYTGGRSGEMGSVHLLDPDLLESDYTRVAGRLEGPNPFTGGGFTLTGNHWLGFAAGSHATISGSVTVTTDRARFEIGGARQWDAFWRTDLAGTGTVVHITGDLTIMNGSQFKVYAGGTNNLTASGVSTLVKVDGTLNHQSSQAIVIGSHHTLGYGAELQVGSLNVADSRSINANARGWRGATGATGNGGSSRDWWGWGEGAGRQRQGAGYGGIGYNYLGDPARGGNTYGDANAPALPGSGGGSGYESWGGGGNGGGLIRIIAAQTITLGANAALNAAGANGVNDGSYAAQRIGGGGSGGGIYLRAQTFHAKAGVTLLAPGGKGARTGYGGGGGRIAIWRVTDTSPEPLAIDPAVHTAGGIGLNGNVNMPEWAGDDGSVVMGWLPSPYPIIYNLAPTNVTATSATLCGYLHAAGDPAAAVSVVWGDSDGGDPTSGLWQFTNAWPAGAWATYDYPSTNVTLPASDRIYYYRFVAVNDAGSSWAAESEYFLGGDVTVGAAGPAAEYGLVPGTITVHRASGAATEEPITVFYEIGGTAIEGEDYVLIPAGRSVMIEAGQTSAQIVVQPLADLDDGEGSETVTLSLLPGKYGIGTPASNTVSITDMAIVPGLNTTVGAGDWNDGSRWSQWRRPAAGDAVEVRHDLQIAASSEAMQSLTVSNATLTAVNWTTVLRAVDIALQSNGVITCSGPFTNGAATSRVYLECTNLTVGAYGRVDVTGKGYQGGVAADGPGHGAGAGFGSTFPAGGGHGGYGGYSGGNGEIFGGGMYDSASEPVLPGSGGGGCQYGGAGTAGGGAVRIEAGDRVTVNGAIRADGVASGLRVGTGSGGSVYIACRRIGGTDGLISADGGASAYTSVEAGSGGGGRIAILNDPAAQALEPLAYVRISAGCGARANNEANRGGIGSIHLSDGRLVADGLANILNGRIESPLQLTSSDLMVTNRWLGFAAGVQATVTGDVLVSGSFAKLEIGGAGMGWYGGTTFRFDQPGGSCLQAGGDLVVTNSAQLRVFGGATTNAALVRGARVDVAGDFHLGPNCKAYIHSHPTNGASPELTMSNFTMANTAVIQATYGFAGATKGSGSSGADNSWWGWGDGKGYNRGGAGHGGSGGLTADSPLSGLTYGDSNAPALPGSGGGSAISYGGDSKAGSGGGLVRLIASNRVTLRSGAQVLVNGLAGTGFATDRLSGGGSGGGVYIRSKRFRGEAGVVINANGGNSSYTGGGGGGGRIAIWRQTDEDPEAATVSVAAGLGYSGGVLAPANNGEAGTIVWGWIPRDGTILLLR